MQLWRRWLEKQLHLEHDDNTEATGELHTYHDTLTNGY